MMHEILSGRAPDYLIEKFSFREHGHNTRSGSLHLNIPRPKTEAMKRSLCTEVPHLGTLYHMNNNSVPH